MIKFETKNLGKVVIRFRHNLPNVNVTPNNSLVSTLNSIRYTQGSTDCAVSIGVNEMNVPANEFFGTSYTHPSDHYKKETGRLLSLHRATEKMLYDGYNETEVRQVMAGYYSR
jgi:hypothetical protein